MVALLQRVSSAAVDIEGKRVSEIGPGLLAELGSILDKPIATGRFAADMQVSLVNDGPVTVWLEV